MPIRLPPRTVPPRSGARYLKSRGLAQVVVSVARCRCPSAVGLGDESQLVGDIHSAGGKSEGFVLERASVCETSREIRSNRNPR